MWGIVAGSANWNSLISSVSPGAHTGRPPRDVAPAAEPHGVFPPELIDD